jgi:hypothetical protein
MEEQYIKLQQEINRGSDGTSPLMSDSLFGSKNSTDHTLLEHFANFITDIETSQGGQISPTTVNITTFTFYLENKAGKDYSQKIQKKLIEFRDSGKISDDMKVAASHSLSNFAQALKEAGIFASGKSPSSLYKAALGKITTAAPLPKVSKVNTPKGTNAPSSGSTKKPGAGGIAGNTPGNEKSELELGTKHEEEDKTSLELGSTSHSYISAETKKNADGPAEIVTQGVVPDNTIADNNTVDYHQDDVAPVAAKKTDSPNTVQPHDIQIPNANGVKQPALAGVPQPKKTTSKELASDGAHTPDASHAPQADSSDKMIIPGKTTRIVPLQKRGTSKEEPNLRQRKETVNRTADNPSPEDDSRRLASGGKQTNPSQERRAQRRKNKGSLPRKVAYAGAGVGGASGFGVLDSFGQNILNSNADFIIELILSFLS